MKSVNRGGLFEVNDESFTFFRAIELKTQQRLPQHLHDPKSTKEHLMKGFAGWLSITVGKYVQCQVEKVECTKLKRLNAPS